MKHINQINIALVIIGIALTARTFTLTFWSPSSETAPNIEIPAPRTSQARPRPQPAAAAPPEQGGIVGVPGREKPVREALPDPSAVNRDPTRGGSSATAGVRPSPTHAASSRGDEGGEELFRPPNPSQPAPPGITRPSTSASRPIVPPSVLPTERPLPPGSQRPNTPLPPLTASQAQKRQTSEGSSPPPVRSSMSEQQPPP